MSSARAGRLLLFVAIAAAIAWAAPAGGAAASVPAVPRPAAEPASPAPTPAAAVFPPLRSGHAPALTGTLRVAVRDGFAARRSTKELLLETEAGTIRLEPGASALQGMPAGSRVALDGTWSANGTFRATSAAVLGQPDTALAAPATAAIRRVAVIVAHYADLAGDPATAGQANAAFNGTATASVARFFEAASRGRVSVQATVFGPWALPISQCPADYAFERTEDAVSAYADSHGIDLAAFDNIVVWTRPPCNTAAGGEGYEPGPYAAIYVDYADGYGAQWPAVAAETASHELGHNLGLDHANGLQCFDASGAQVTTGTGCTASTYDDPFSAMGSMYPRLTSSGQQWVHPLFDSEDLRKLGWLTPNEVADVTGAATIALVPVYSSAPGVREIRIRRPSAPLAFDADWPIRYRPYGVPVQAGYWSLEIRSPGSSGFDAFGSTDEVANGVTVRFASDAYSDGYGSDTGATYMLDFDPTSSASRGLDWMTDMWDGPLAAGKTFTDAVSGFAVTVSSASPAGATVVVHDLRNPPGAPTGVEAMGRNGGAVVYWMAPSSNGGAAIASYTVTASPGGARCTASGLSCLVGGLANGTAYTFAVSATNAVGTGPSSASSPAVVPYAGATYVPLTPTRIVDSRPGTRLGLSASLAANRPVAFLVAGRSPGDPSRDVPADAVAVTGNLTVAGDQTAAGYLTLTPTRPGGPLATSTLNFPRGDVRANAVTIPVTTSGRCWVTYISQASSATADVVFDVTGYFVAGTAGARYVPVTPNRIVDSRAGTRLGLTSSVVARMPARFQVTGRSADPAKNVPAGAIAVSGNLTVAGQTARGYLALTPAKPAGVPATSTLNFPFGDVRANAVTIPLGTGGGLWVTFAGLPDARADVVFDVTGYFTAGGSGAVYVPLAPNRLVDSRAGVRLGISGSPASGVPVSLGVTNRSTDPAKNVPAGALAVTGNLTVTGQTSRGYLSLTPARPAGIPATSTLNFPIGDVRASAVATPLGNGQLWVTFTGLAGARTDVVFDVTGYFYRP